MGHFLFRLLLVMVICFFWNILSIIASTPEFLNVFVYGGSGLLMQISAMFMISSSNDKSNKVNY